MKHHRSVCCLVAAMLTAASAFAQEPVDSVRGHSLEFNLKPIIGVTSGSTKFVMDVRSTFGTEAIGGMKSELEYPLGTTLAGVQAGLGPHAGTKNEWGVELSFLTNLNDPGKVMKDHDWFAIPGGFSGKWSYTESRATLSSTQLTLEGYKSFLWHRSYAAGLYGGFKYQKFSQKLYGYEGWQILFDTATWVPQDTGALYGGADVLALTYKVTYMMPMIGVYARLTPAPILNLNAKLAFAPTFANDVDDHVLRYKLSKAKGSGRALIAGLQTSFRPFKGAQLGRALIEGSIDYLTLTVKTTGDQRWYGDEGDIPAGTYYSRIPHSFYSHQLTVSARAGITF